MLITIDTTSDIEPLAPPQAATSSSVREVELVKRRLLRVRFEATTTQNSVCGSWQSRVAVMRLVALFGVAAAVVVGRLSL